MMLERDQTYNDVIDRIERLEKRIEDLRDVSRPQETIIIGAPQVFEGWICVDTVLQAINQQIILDPRVTPRIQIGNGLWLGLAGDGGRIVFADLATDQIQLADADLYLPTGLGIIHADGVAAGTYLRADGTRYVPSAIQAADLPGGFSGFANPTGTIGLAVVNGVLTTAMRSDAAPPLSQSIIPIWTGLHTFEVGITFSGASGANNVMVPDNVAIALELLDAGGIEYLRLISTNAQPIISWNEAGADIDFKIEGVGEANALFVQGSNGDIGIGTATPQVPLHIWMSNAGADPVWSAGIDIVLFESSGNVNTQLFCPADKKGVIGFSDPDARNVGFIAYDHTTDRIDVAANGATGLVLDSNTYTLVGGMTASLDAATLQVRATTANTIGAIVRGRASQAENLQEWQSSVPATLTAIEKDGDLWFSSGIGIVHADGVVAGTVLRANGTRFVPGAIATGDVAALAAQFVCLVADANLANERVLTGGNSIMITDGGAGLAVTMALAMPGTCAVASVNSAIAPHTHAITSSSNPGAAAAILKTSAAGALTLTGILSLAEYMDHIGDADTYWRFQDDNITICAGGVDMVDIVEAVMDYVNFPAGPVFVNETSNMSMTRGITINIGDATNEIMAWKMSGFAHGMTDFAETDTLGDIVAVAYGAAGGVNLRGFTQATAAIDLVGNGTVDDTTKAATSRAYVEIYARKKSGTNVGSPGADANLFAVRGGLDTTMALIDQEGELHLHSIVNENAWDEHDDLMVLDGLRASLVPPGHYLRRQFGEFIAQARPLLEAAGVVHYNDGPGKDGHAFVGMQGLQMLTIDVLRQLYRRVLALDARLKLYADA